MQYAVELESALSDPKALEDLFQRARLAGDAADFASEVARRHGSSPESILLSAWYFRLLPEYASDVTLAKEPTLALAKCRFEEHGREINWRLAIALSIGLSLLYWFLTGDTTHIQQTPVVLLAWAPAAACLILAFLTLTSLGTQTMPTSPRRAPFTSPRGALLIALGLIALTAYALWMGFLQHDSYRNLMILHLPLLAWVAILLYVVGPGLDDSNRYAALVKSAEIVLVGGILFGAAMVFVAITQGLFSAIGVSFPEPVQRWLFVGVPGLIPVLAVALMYDPKLPPAEQRFDQGLPKLIVSVARIFLPFALTVGLIYVMLIPANFLKPFEQREVLIVYNAMLFGVMALLLFATPLGLEDVPAKWQIPLRSAILALAVMAVIVSLYAMSATVYRTVLGGITMNRLTVIGWNVINIALLCLFLYRQFRFGRGMWIRSTQSVFRIGMLAYGLWTIFLTLAVPLLFPSG